MAQVKFGSQSLGLLFAERIDGSIQFLAERLETTHHDQSEFDS